MKWLENKISKITKTLEAKKVNVSLNSASATNFAVDSDTTENERKLYAFELLEDYIPDSLALVLRKHLK